MDYGLKYEANQKINLEGYEDSYWAGSAIDRKSTSRCYFIMGSSMKQIIRLTSRVMWIHIGQEVPFIKTKL